MIIGLGTLFVTILKYLSFGVLLSLSYIYANLLILHISDYQPVVLSYRLILDKYIMLVAYSY